MRGSRLSAEIISDMKREKYFKKKAIRNHCMVDSKKQCNKCKYIDICENTEKQNS